MNERGAPKIAGILALVAVVWVLAYWFTPATRSPSTTGAPQVSVDTSGSDADTAPESEQSEPARALDSPVDPLGSPQFVDRGEAGVQTPVGTDEEGAPRGEDDQGDEQGAGVVPPEWFYHTVAPEGETLEDIALRYFGKRGYWRAIARMNGGTADPNRIRPGQRLKIPTDPQNVQGLPADDPISEPEPEPEPAYTEYIVSRNDTLWDIAKALYGNGAKWTVIRDANRALVGDEGQRLREGMTLRIPPPPGE